MVVCRRVGKLEVNIMNRMVPRMLSWDKVQVVGVKRKFLSKRYYHKLDGILAQCREGTFPLK